MGVISNGTTLLDAGALDSGIATGDMILIKTLTASSSANLTFHNGASDVVFDGTYKEYVFRFLDIHAQTDGAFFSFQANAAGASGFNETVTSAAFEAYHAEDDGSAALGYSASSDKAQATTFINLNCGAHDADNDSCSVGSLRIFDPANTTFVKHFIAETNNKINGSETDNSFFAGYFNTTTAIDEIQFKFNSGNIDSGQIKLYGIK